MIRRLRNVVIVSWLLVAAAIPVWLVAKVVQANLPLRTFEEPESIRLPAGVTELAEWESGTDSPGTGRAQIQLVRLVEVPELECEVPETCDSFEAIATRFADAAGGGVVDLVSPGSTRGFVSSSWYFFSIPERGLVDVSLVDPAVTDDAVRAAEPDAGPIPDLGRCRSQVQRYRCVLLRFS